MRIHLRQTCQTSRGPPVGPSRALVELGAQQLELDVPRRLRAPVGRPRGPVRRAPPRRAAFPRPHVLNQSNKLVTASNIPVILQLKATVNQYNWQIPLERCERQRRKYIRLQWLEKLQMKNRKYEILFVSENMIS